MKEFFQLSAVAVLLLAICLSSYRLWSMATGGNANININLPPQASSGDGTSEASSEQISSAQSPLAPQSPQISQTPQTVQVDVGQIVDVTLPQPPVIANPFLLDMRRDINSDIVGWLTLPGAGIDYPIVQTDNNDFYLKHNINKDKASAGSIFMDYRSDPELAHFNTVIYGHNMKNRTMFGKLRLYADPDFFEENKTGTLYTVYGTYTINVFAYLVISSDDEVIYSNMPATEGYYDYIEENAHNYREPATPERIITLSTCSYEFDGARIVVLAYI